MHLLGTSIAPKLARQVGSVVPAHIACIDVALERLPNSRAPVVFDMQQPRFVTAQSTVARVAPNGGAVIHAFKQLDPRVAGDQHQDAADIEAALDHVQPGWRGVLVERHFLPRMLGSSLLPLASQGGLAGRPAYQSQDVPNVYFAGDWVGPRGYLADASFHSAREAARMMLRSAEPLRQLLQAAA
jgi:phytoene dehydrogenase-like protein